MFLPLADPNLPQKSPRGTIFLVQNEKSQNYGLQLSKKDILSALKDIEGINTLASEKIENTLFTIPERTLEKIRTTLESEKEKETSILKKRRKMYKEILEEKINTIRKHFGDKNEISYLSEEKFCERVNAKHTVLSFFLQNGGAEKREDGEIYITERNLINIENRCKEILAVISEEEKKAEEKEREKVKKPPIPFSILLLELKQYLDTKRIKEARYVPLNYNDFYVESGVKKKYSLPEEVENKFKKLVEKYKRKIGEQDYIIPEVKKEIEKERSESEALQIVKDFITQHEKLGKLAGFGLRRADCEPFMWKILTDVLECKKPEGKDDEVFVTNKDFQHLIMHKGELANKHIDDKLLPTKMKKERKGLTAERIKEFFRSSEQKWYSTSEIAEALGVDPQSSTLSDNLERLLDEKDFEKKKEEKIVQYMLKKKEPPVKETEKEPKREKKGVMVERIEEFFRSNEQKWYSLSEIADALGIDPYSKTLFRNLRKLLEKKILKKRRKGREVHYSLKEK